MLAAAFGLALGAAALPCAAQAPGPATAPALPAVPAPAALVVQRVQVDGATRLAPAEIEAITAPFLNRPLRTLDLEALRQRLSEAYVERGYVNSGARIDEAALAQGELRLRIVEGRLGALQQRGLDGLSERYLAARLLGSDEIFHQGRLQERFQQLLGDPLFERLNARVLPGTEAGQALLDVEVQRARPWSLALFAHNQGAPAVGSTLAGVEFALRNLVGWGDALQATASASSQHGSNVNGDLAWSLPLAAGRTQLGLRVASARASVIEEPLQALDIDSRVQTRELSLSHPLVDEPRQRIALGLASSHRSNRTTLAGEPFSFVPGEATGTTRLHATRLSLDLTWRQEQQVLAAQLAYTQGRNNVGAAPSLERVPAARYGLWQLQAQAVLGLDQGAAGGGRQLLLRGQLQHSGDALVPLEQMALGGRRTVRGFRENQLVRDNAWALSAELNWPLWRDEGRRAGLSLVPFVDTGAAWNRGEAQQSLSSAGLGLQASWGGLEFELFVAHRIDPRSSAGRGDLQDHGIHFLLRFRPLP